jgi:hypothetical protein
MDSNTMSPKEEIPLISKKQKIGLLEYITLSAGIILFLSFIYLLLKG